MQCDELSAREEFTYSHVPTLERANGSLGRRGDRGTDRRPDRGERYRPERDSYTVDVRASDLQLAQPEHLKHPCFSYRAWLYSVLIGVRREIGQGELQRRHITGCIYLVHDTQILKVGVIFFFFDERVSQSRNFERDGDMKSCFVLPHLGEEKHTTISANSNRLY